MLTSDRDRLRRFFITAWQKAHSDEPLEPLEHQIVDVVRAHPEYHALMEDVDDAVSREFSPEAGESNPFLHLSLHIAILEQVKTDRPAGIRRHYERLAASAGDAHQAEHWIMECLAQSLWEAQRAGNAPNESDYLACIERLTAGAHGRQ
jgi:hypothetical protein